ncbi:MAG: 4'-phosphopantetheinyl transferase superfamily protein [Gammaproteobacteria bacterium]|nr:4'-phosphopantetheinyl transferase superfamily protein [Gammaproteobacteria bacterium]
MNNWNTPAEESINLKDNEVHIWLFQLNTSPHAINNFYTFLSNDEKKRSERLINFMHRKRFISFHGFMRSVLTRYTSTPEHKLSFKTIENGKPCLIDNHNNIQFNLSHSHNMALLGICKNNEIGVDIEHIDRDNNWQGIIRRFFTQTEQQNIFSLPEERQKLAFFETWTRKEAHMKVTGKGLLLSPTQFTVSTPPENARLIDCPYDTTIKPEDWSMREITMPSSASNYCGCLSRHGIITEINHYLYK